MSSWTYNAFRATLLRDGRPFAIVTPDGKNALSKVDERLLVDALNRTTTVAPEPQPVTAELGLTNEP